MVNHRDNREKQGMAEMIRARGSFKTSGALVVGLLVFGIASTGVANPGSEVESPRARMGKEALADPEVAKVDSALHERVRGAQYQMEIFNTREAIVLRGQVDSERSRQEILSVARSVSSKPVRDELRLRPTLSDEQIQEQLRSTIDSQYPQLKKRVAVEVKDGVAYLSGNVSRHQEVDELLASTLMFEGVRDIQSDITVAGKPYVVRHPRAKRAGQ